LLSRVRIINPPWSMIGRIKQKSASDAY